jgi:Tryptophan-rich Synechocystis species C-terminal domain
VWNTDGSGNYVSDTIGMVSGASTALEWLETSFHQDLNGDGTIDPVASSALAQPATINATASPNDTNSAAQSIFQKFGVAGNDTFVFRPNGRGCHSGC